MRLILLCIGMLLSGCLQTQEDGKEKQDPCTVVTRSEAGGTIGKRNDSEFYWERIIYRVYANGSKDTLRAITENSWSPVPGDGYYEGSVVPSCPVHMKKQNDSISKDTAVPVDTTAIRMRREAYRAIDTLCKQNEYDLEQLAQSQGDADMCNGDTSFVVVDGTYLYARDIFCGKYYEPEMVEAGIQMSVEWLKKYPGKVDSLRAEYQEYFQGEDVRWEGQCKRRVMDSLYSYQLRRLSQAEP